MKQSEINRMKSSSFLLPPPGDVVAYELLEKIEEIIKAGRKLWIVVNDNASREMINKIEKTCPDVISLFKISNDYCTNCKHYYNGFCFIDGPDCNNGEYYDEKNVMMKKNKMSTSLYLPVDFHKKVKEEASKRRYTVNQWITLLLAREMKAGDIPAEIPATDKRDWALEQREHRAHLKVLRNDHVEEWEDKEKFLQDMGPCPSTEYYLVCLDEQRPYSKENCMWATLNEKQFIKRVINTYVEYGPISSPVGSYCSVSMVKEMVLEKRKYKKVS